MRDVLRLKMIDGLASPPPAFTRREVRLPRVDRRALAVVGVRRSGKTTFLWQCLADRLVAGTPRESMLFLCFEDDRLPDLAAADLTWLLEEFYRHHPASRDSQTVTFLTEGGFPETLGTGERDRARRLRSYVDVEDPLQPHDHFLILFHNHPNPALPIPGAMVSLPVVASNGPAEEP